MKNTRLALEFLTGILLGAAIWAISPFATGEVEPWDAVGLYYVASLFASGVVAAAVFPERFWVAPIGIYIGQFAYAFIFLPVGPLVIIGLIAGAVYTVPSFCGAAATYCVSVLLRKLKTSGPNHDRKPFNPTGVG